MLAVIVLCLLLCIIIIVRGKIKGRSAYKLPPALPGELPIIGHTHTLFTDVRKDFWSFVKKISAYATEKGGIIYWQILNDKYYIITDPEDAFTVANSCLVKHFAYQFGKGWIGQGLITGSGETYKFHRKLLNSKHATPVVHAYLKLFNDKSRKICSEMNAYSGKKPFDVTNIIKSVILETACLLSGVYTANSLNDYYIGKILHYYGCNPLKNPGSAITGIPVIADVAKYQRPQVTTFGSNVKDDNLLHNYMIAVDEAMRMFTYRFTNVFLYYDFMYRLLGFQKKEDQITSILGKITTKVFEKNKVMNSTNITTNADPDLINNQDLTYKSMIDYLVELESDGLLTEDEVKEELDTNIGASFDTIVHTLLNILLLLGTYPEVQDRMYEELIQVLGMDRDVEKQNLKNLVYIRAVIKETLRVMPTVPMFARYADKEVKLKSYTIPAGSQCVIISYGINRSPAWGPDADQFKPERWLDPASVPSNSNCFAGFSMGKRSCIGKPYAMTLLTVALAHLVRHLKWTADITRVKTEYHITLQPTAGHEISVERRSGL